MASVKELFSLFTFIFCFEVLKILSIISALVNLPFRFLRKKNSPSPTPPTARVKATIKIHQPGPGHSTPRDTLVFIHGYPDSSSLWDATVSKLTEQGYRCVTVDLPGSKGEPITRLVYPPEMVQLLYAALEPVCDKPFTLVAHDWGSFYGTLLRKAHPDLIHRVVLLDVGSMSTKSDFPLIAWACILSYQSTFALMFFIGEPSYGLLSYALKIFRYRARPLKEVTVDMYYHYASMLFAIIRMMLPFRKETDSNERDSASVVPMLFVYGSKKLFNFHDSFFKAKVRASPCGEVVGLPCGHWIMVDLPDEWTTLLTDWLQKSEKEIPAET